MLDDALRDLPRRQPSLLASARAALAWRSANWLGRSTGSVPSSSGPRARVIAADSRGARRSRGSAMPLTLGLPPCRSPFLPAWTRSAGWGRTGPPGWTGSRAWPPTSWRSGGWCSTGPRCTATPPWPSRCGRSVGVPRSSRSPSTATTSPSTRGSPCSAGTATAPSSCCGPTRTGAPSCWSGCTPRTWATCGTSRRARWSPASTHGSTCPRCRSCAPSRRTSSGGPPRSRPCRATPRPAPPGRAGAVAGARPGRGRGQHRHPRPRGPPLRQRAGRRPGAVAGHRPQADGRRPALRAGAAAVEPVGRAGGAGPACATGCAAASTRSSTRPASTRTGPGTGWSSGWCSTRTGRCRTPSAPAGASTPDEREWITRCIAIAKAVQDWGPGPSARRAGTSALPGSPGGGLPRE